MKPGAQSPTEALVARIMALCSVRTTFIDRRARLALGLTSTANRAAGWAGLPHGPDCLKI